MKMKGQVSTEMLALVGIMLFLLLPLLLYAYGKSNSSNEDISVQKAEFAVQRLASSADSVGYLGGKAGIVEEIEIPPNIKSITLGLNKHDIIMEVSSSSGRKQIVKSSTFKIRESGFDRINKAGTYFFEIIALSEYAGSGSEEVGITVK